MKGRRSEVKSMDCNAFAKKGNQKNINLEGFPLPLVQVFAQMLMLLLFKLREDTTWPSHLQYFEPNFSEKNNSYMKTVVSF